jgi:hypothetical protein
VAPRRLIYAHEFAWDRARDPELLNNNLNH